MATKIPQGVLASGRCLTLTNTFASFTNTAAATAPVALPCPCRIVAGIITTASVTDANANSTIKLVDNTTGTPADLMTAKASVASAIPVKIELIPSYPLRTYAEGTIVAFTFTSGDTTSDGMGAGSFTLIVEPVQAA